MSTDTVVCREGASGNEMFLVLSGRLKALTIQRGTSGSAGADGDDEERDKDGNIELTLSMMGPGDHFGELALLNPLGVRAATVVTTEPSELLRIDRADFQRVTKIGRKAANREKTADGAWGSRAKALHAAAFAGDILGVERALVPENEARISGIKEKRRMVWV